MGSETLLRPLRSVRGSHAARDVHLHGRLRGACDGDAQEVAHVRFPSAGSRSFPCPISLSVDVDERGGRSRPSGNVLGLFIAHECAPYHSDLREVSSSRSRPLHGRPVHVHEPSHSTWQADQSFCGTLKNVHWSRAYHSRRSWMSFSLMLRRLSFGLTPAIILAYCRATRTASLWVSARTISR